MRDDSALRPRPLAAGFTAETIEADWRVLCEEIGERRAGSNEEKRAAEFVAARFREAGIADIEVESFPCRSLRRGRAQVHEREGRRWRAVEAVPLVGAPGTPQGRAVTGELVWLELPENAARIQPDAFRNRIVAVFGPLPTSLQVHQRLVAAKPLAVIHVDDRLPFDWVKNDGVYPHWAQAHGMPPTLTVPYLQGWRWRRTGVRELKVQMEVELVDATSQNVVAEIPGQSAELPAIVLSAHHDTQCGNTGADDNASGVVSLLALARAFSGARFRRTIRLISFGAEEQLSVGSFAYVGRHHPTTRDVGLVVNFDSVASPLGHWVISVPGATELARYSRGRLAASGLDVEVRPEVTPFSDQFPFNRMGIPSLWFMRTNFPGGRWQHHSAHDALENVSIPELQRLLTAVHPFVTTLARSARWPFPATLPKDAQALARKLGRELFGAQQPKKR